jgi:hypothetical protein
MFHVKHLGGNGDYCFCIAANSLNMGVLEQYPGTNTGVPKQAVTCWVANAARPPEAIVV